MIWFKQGNIQSPRSHDWNEYNGMQKLQNAGLCCSPCREKSLCGSSTGLVRDAMMWNPVPLKKLSQSHSALQVSKVVSAAPLAPHALCILRDHVQPPALGHVSPSPSVVLMQSGGLVHLKNILLCSCSLSESKSDRAKTELTHSKL